MDDGRRTELIEGVDGPRLAKVATDPAGRPLIAQEAKRLSAARHPGVVELIHHDEDRIEVAWAGERTIELIDLDLDGATALLAAIAAIVADLHDLGLVHGRLDPTHVIVGPDGGPRLCGMSGPRPDESEPEPSADVAALGRIIHRLVGDGASAEPIPESRWRRRRWSGYQQRALQTLADQAQADDVERRPSARTLANAIAEVAPGARLTRPAVAPPEPPQRTGPADPADAGGPPDHPSTADPSIPAEAPEPSSDVDPPVTAPSRSATATRAAPSVADRPTWSRSLVAAAVLASIAVVAFVGSGVLRSEDPSSGTAAPTHRVETSTEPTDPSAQPDGRSTPTSTTSIVHPSTTAPPHCTPVVGMAADVDDDGCPDPVVIEGTTITVGNIVFRAGVEDDDVVVGDWRCTGLVTPGVVRPATGEVFLFDHWPDDDGRLEVDPVAIVPGGTRLVMEEGSCGAPAVESPDGELTRLNLPERSG